jgi:hypothetical protein|tara:strand:+ start:519 stop:923 length:405 start_codon:yes stop_codon:yes gene_type:complete
MANIPPLKRFGGVREIKKRVRGSELLQDSRDALAQHLIDLATVNIDEIMEYDGHEIKVKAFQDIDKKALSAIKRIRVNQGVIDVELHDKVKILQTLAKAAGLLDPESNSERPSVVGIKMVGPKEVTDVDIKKDE